MDTPGNDPPSNRRRRSSSKKRRPSSRSNRRRNRNRSRERSNKRNEEKKSVIDKEDFRELDDVVPPWTKKQSGGGRRRRSSRRARSSVDDQVSDPGECCCGPCKCGNGGGTSEYGSEATFAKKVVRRDVSLKLRPNRPGTFEPEEDTLRDPGDWGPTRSVSRAPPRSKCNTFECTVRKVLTKAIEYGVVAGIVVAIYAVVTRQRK